MHHRSKPHSLVLAPGGRFPAVACGVGCAIGHRNVTWSTARASEDVVHQSQRSLWPTTIKMRMARVARLFGMGCGSMAYPCVGASPSIVDVVSVDRRPLKSVGHAGVSLVQRRRGWRGGRRARRRALPAGPRLLRRYGADHRRVDHRLPQGHQPGQTFSSLSCHTRRGYLVSLKRTRRRRDTREQIRSLTAVRPASTLLHATVDERRQPAEIRRA